MEVTVTAGSDSFLDFRRDLRDALRRPSAAALRTILWRWADPGTPTLRYFLGLSDDALEAVARRLILADRQLADQHGPARRWLSARGLPVVAPKGDRLADRTSPASRSGPASAERVQA